MKHLITTRPRAVVSSGLWALVLLLVGLLAGCDRKATVVVVEPDYPDERGELLGNLDQMLPDVTAYALLDWSRDGKELYYLGRRAPAFSAPQQGVYAFDIARRTARLVAEDARWQEVPLPGPGLIGQSADGQNLYLYAGNRPLGGSPSSFHFYQVPLRRPGSPTVFAGPEAPGASGQQPLVCADGTWLGIGHRPDSVRLYELGTAQKLALAGRGLQALSPDGRQVLVRNGNVNEWDVVDRGNFSRTVLRMDAFPTNAVGVSLLYPEFWGPAGFSMLYKQLDPQERTQLQLRALAQQTSTLLWTGGTPNERLKDSPVLAHDGRRAAFWTFNDWRTGYKERHSTTLYVADLARAQTVAVASLTRTSAAEERGGVNWTVIAYDNSRLAYTFGNKLYLKDLP